MFGFLKEKLNNFGQKLKETVSGKEKEQVKKTAQIDETKKEDTPQKEEIKEEEKAKSEIPPTQKKEMPHTEKKEVNSEIIIEEKKEEKNEETEKLEEKLFKEIEEEIKKEDEGKIRPEIKENVLEEIPKDTVKITYFVHGTTTDNEEDKSTGWNNGELSTLGKKQSIELTTQTEEKKFDVVFCSDLKRAIDSAELSFGNKYKIVQDQRIRECNYGDWNGADSKKVEGYDYLKNKYPNGESYEDVEKRIAKFLNYLYKEYRGKHVAIVAHKVPQLAIEVMLNNKTWEQAIKEDWRKTKKWRPGWEYWIKSQVKERQEETQKEKKGLLEKLFGTKKKEAPTTPKEKLIEDKDKPKTIEELKEEKVEKETTEEIKEVKKAIEEEAKEPKITQEEEKLDEIEEEEKESGEEETERRMEEQEKRMSDKREELLEKEIKKAEEDKRELKAKVGVGSGLKAFIFGGVEINEKEIEELLEELEMSLLESDVEQDAARELTQQIKKKLIGQKVSAKNIDQYLKEQIKEILKEMMTTEKINLLEKVASKKEKPYRILMLGPNGAGKTTSIAKLTRLFEKNNKTCVWAAADTFRAAAIDQLEEHAKKLNVRMIKHQYGADPAAVAFDAIKAAEAGKNDVVIIDSAGRQETNKNLMEELNKIERVAKPDLKLYVGEAYAGQGLLEQAKEFDDLVGLDGFILTKIDTDAKGGTAISLLYKLKKPILYVGTGQGYDDFQEFTEDFIINRII